MIRIVLTILLFLGLSAGTSLTDSEITYDIIGYRKEFIYLSDKQYQVKYFDKIYNSIRRYTKDEAKLYFYQSAVESNWGKSALANYNNYYGIKGRDVVFNTKEFTDSGYVNIKAGFKAYENVDECIKHRSKISWKGYATEPGYKTKLEQITKHNSHKIQELSVYKVGVYIDRQLQYSYEIRIPVKCGTEVERR